jgi:SAM-dependent methyltransferase
VQTPALLSQRRNWAHRRLEIGPGPQRIEDFETLNVVPGANVDYVWNASSRLPFDTGTFQLIYASHVLEHIPWYHVDEVLAEWVRVLAPRGRIEIWVPDGLKICQAFVDAETKNSEDFHRDGWYRFNERKDPCRWASGRLFSYGDGGGTRGHENWHLAVFSFRYLEETLIKAGCASVEPLDRSQVRGHDHGWINLGIAGTKR